MVRVSRDKAAENRAKLVAGADRLLREKGYEGLSVAAAAQSVGLTEGAVFRNFPTKAALAAAAVEEGFAPILAMLGTLDGEAGLRVYASNCLGTDHRDHFAWGCPVGALAAEMHRHPDEVKAAFVRGQTRLLDELTRLAGSRMRASSVLATLAGAIGIARALSAAGDRAASDAFLEDIRRDLTAVWDRTSN